MHLETGRLLKAVAYSRAEERRQPANNTLHQVISAERQLNAAGVCAPPREGELPLDPPVFNLIKLRMERPSHAPSRRIGS